MGITILVPVCQLLIDHVGWRWAFRALGLAVVGWLVPATLWLLRERPRGRAVSDRRRRRHRRRRRPGTRRIGR